MTCNSTPPGAKHHVHSSTSTVLSRRPSITVSPLMDTVRDVLLNFTEMSFLVIAGSWGKRIWISS
eukprot:CAMPEP_0177238610 /NCGR_PEP_ID=MMETSP0367-20130122/46651_1 /TAXON_ID=447022 ORGANISM="Scrippsiella hangoei-like, Strain SHHI-4" /NCGR_SAMPLE_ID=MMETSP0367 /ASSEMBLY_ACC=CAM_ASM_000362 /LENGTH=64 /DNA_ID=CAMNT_0018689741 /DNA_START=124 /DNA_END=314 /DNA_ORIENTATION=-